METTKKQALLMNPVSGSVQTEEDWRDDYYYAMRDVDPSADDCETEDGWMSSLIEVRYDEATQAYVEV